MQGTRVVSGPPILHCDEATTPAAALHTPARRWTAVREYENDMVHDSKEAKTGTRNSPEISDMRIHIISFSNFHFLHENTTWLKQKEEKTGFSLKTV